jgi:DNA-binding MarR family transcriptional regulator
VSVTIAERLLGVLESFVGRLHCGSQSAGIEALIAADLTFSQMRTLLVLTQQPEPIPIHEIATRLELSVAAAGRNVDQLVRLGLLDRVEDEVDRRIKRISLNGPGRDLIAMFKAGQRRYALELLADVDDHDARRLIDALGPVMEKLGCSAPSTEQISSTIAPPPSKIPHDQEIPA